MQLSYSRVDCHQGCPRKYRYRYVDGLKVLPDDKADNALYLGTALHTALEKDFETARAEYFENFPVITQEQWDEMEKLKAKVRVLKPLIPEDAIFERKILSNRFIGFIDMLVPNDDGTFDLYDFKYSNNVDRYLASEQLHLYKYYYERTTGRRIHRMYYLIVPKDDREPIQVEIPFDFRKVIGWLEKTQDLLTDQNYLCRPKFCKWCDYRDLCTIGEDWMILPSTQRRNLSETRKRKVWIYGAPFSGKTTLVDAAPNPLNLNTDGNINYVTMPVLPIKDEVTTEGRITKRKLAWDVFKEALEELEKKDNDFETIVIDLLEDTYESCRIYMYDKLGITHESDDSFRAWDKVRTEYLSTMRRFFNLDYQNLVVISHEDKTRDIMKKSGDRFSTIKPNLQDKVANKIAGMVDLVARVVVEEDGTRTLQFKADETVFGGGRLKGVNVTSVPLDWDALCEVFDEAGESGEVKAVTKTEEPVKKTRTRAKKEPEPVEVEEPTPEVVETPDPVVETDDLVSTTETTTEEVPRRRRTRKARD